MRRGCRGCSDPTSAGTAGPGLRDAVREDPVAEVGDRVARRQGRERSGVLEVALPRSRGTVVQIPLGAGSRHVDCAIGAHVLDRLRDDVVLVGRLGVIGRAVDDHVTAIIEPEAPDVVREARGADACGREHERGLRRHVVDDLHQGSAFTRSRASILTWNRDCARRQVAGRDRRLFEVVAVGQNADRDTGACRVVELARAADADVLIG